MKEKIDFFQERIIIKRADIGRELMTVGANTESNDLGCCRAGGDPPKVEIPGISGRKFSAPFLISAATAMKYIEMCPHFSSCCSRFERRGGARSAE